MDNLRAILATVLLFIGLFFVVTVSLWLLWNLVMPSLGVPKMNYWTFLGFYVLIRGLLTDLSKSGGKV